MSTDVCVYELRSPYGYAYVGITNNLKRRLKSHSKKHKNKVFSAHQKKYDLEFNDFSIHVVERGLTRKEAKKVEKNRIVMYEEKGKSLNYLRRNIIGESFEVEMPNGETKTI